MNILALLLIAVPAHAELAVLRSAASLPAQNQSAVFDGSLGTSTSDVAPIAAMGETSSRASLSPSRVTPALRAEVPSPAKTGQKSKSGNGAGFIFDVTVGAILIAAGVALSVGPAAPIGAMLAGAGLKILGILSLAKAFRRFAND